MNDGGDDAALIRLLVSLQQHGIRANGVRDWPKERVLSVTADVFVRHEGGRYHWREGSVSCSHTDTDLDGAVERLTRLCRRLRGPSFTAAYEPPSGNRARDR
jgi:hypothetical protein